jgi:hypothetical protein
VSANTGLLTNISSITQVSVQDTATLLRTTSGREGVILYNNSATVTVWVGDSSIVSGQGTPIPPETPMAFGLNGAELWGVGDVGVAVVNVSHGIIA